MVLRRIPRTSVRANEVSLCLRKKPACFVAAIEPRQLVPETLEPCRRNAAVRGPCGRVVSFFTDSGNDPVKGLAVALLAGQQPRTQVQGHEIIRRELFETP